MTMGIFFGLTIFTFKVLQITSTPLRVVLLNAMILYYPTAVSITEQVQFFVDGRHFVYVALGHDLVQLHGDVVRVCVQDRTCENVMLLSETILFSLMNTVQKVVSVKCMKPTPLK